MGKAEIISGGTGGKYSVRLKLDRSRVDSELAYWAIYIPELVSTIAGMDDGPDKDAAILRKVSAEKRVQYLNENIEDDPVVDAWCADLTEGIVSVYVGTIEVPGERFDVPVIIQPAYLLAAEYDQIRDGQLQPALAGTPAGVIYNLCMMPGWQKWKPIYRLGEITVKDGDTCSVAIDPATFSARGSGLSPSLDVNQDTVSGLVTLENVPIVYMSCNGLPFEVGDRVVVKFTDQDWSQPVVIGFEDNPKPCAVGVLIVKITGVYYAGTFPIMGAYPAKEDQYFAWNSGTDSTLLVPKTGGGFWDYPLSASEYSGDFQIDLTKLFGPGKSIDPPSPLFAVSSVVSDMDATNISPVHWIYDGGLNLTGAVGIIRGQGTLDGPNPNDYFGEGTTEAEAIDDLTWEFSSTPEYNQPNGSVPNAGGSNDTWSDSATTYYTERVSDFTIQTMFNEGLWFAFYVVPGSFLFTYGGDRVLSFDAPFGGVPSDVFYLGFLAEHDPKIPPPATSQTILLELANGSTGDDVVAGPAINYSGSASFTQNHSSVYDSGSNSESQQDFTSDMSGAGTLTFQSGVSVDISAEFEESGSVVNPHAEHVNDWDNPFYWPSPYSPQKKVTYAISDCDIAHGYGQAENWQSLIIVETQESGSMVSLFSAPDPPYVLEPFVVAAPKEIGPVTTNRIVNYYIVNGKCGIVTNAYTNNPWDLEENDGFKTEIASAINSFVTNNPLAINEDRWVIKPKIEHLTW